MGFYAVKAGEESFGGGALMSLSQMRRIEDQKMSKVKVTPKIDLESELKPIKKAGRPKGKKNK